jgi:8-oxo-dGTP pyrophosphatase MutT (NUDIX family)
LYILLLPLIRIVIRRTRRAYVLLVCEGEVLLVKNWLARDRFWLPGGGVHKNESMQDGAVRETYEEFGVKVDNSQLKSRAKGRMQDDNLGFEYEIFTCYIAKKPIMVVDKNEIVEYGWYSSVPKGCSKMLAGIISEILV